MINDIASDERLAWFAMRGSGIILLVLLTAAVVVGVAAIRSPGPTSGGRLPRFARQSVHRDLSVMSLVLLVVHIVTAVVHDYVDITWVDAIVPFVGAYEPLWIGLGTLSSDLLIVAAATAAVRGRLGAPAWRIVHVTTYAAWVVAMIHTVGIGTDISEPWAIATAAACGVAFVVAVVWRLITSPRPAIASAGRR